MIALASVFFADLDTTIQLLASFQYHMAPYYNSLDTHLGLLVEYISLAFEQSDQTHQVLSLVASFRTMKELKG